MEQNQNLKQMRKEHISLQELFGITKYEMKKQINILKEAERINKVLFVFENSYVILWII